MPDYTVVVYSLPPGVDRDRLDRALQNAREVISRSRPPPDVNPTERVRRPVQPMRGEYEPQ